MIILQTLVTVTITVTDVNDLSPQCIMNPFVFTVDEDNVNAVRLGVIETTDGDFGDNAIVRYGIASGDPSGLFTIDSTTVSIQYTIVWALVFIYPYYSIL